MNCKGRNKMLSIGAFSKISNVTTKTLRYYDEIGLIKPVYVNDENGYRYYSTSQLETVLLIGKLKWYCLLYTSVMPSMASSTGWAKSYMG